MAGCFSIARLSSLRLPETGDLKRDMPTPPRKRKKGYVESFDGLTLIYDCFYDSAARQVILICPRLLNLWPVLRDGLSINGQPAGDKLRRTKRLRVEILRIALPERPNKIEVIADGQTHSLPVLEQDAADFANRNVLMAISKDNPIEWIEDWLRYHISAHGADAVLLIDNGSSAYTPEILLQRLSAVPGLSACRIISAPFPYGGSSGGRLSPPAKYLQTSMFNVAQQRFLIRARAVLSIDVDEFVWPRNGSIFDATAASALGMISFLGHWVYPSDVGSPASHRGHSMRVGRKMGRNPKWCMVPDSLAGRFSWAIHRPGGPFYPLTIRRRFGFWHFYATSTSWKNNRTKLVQGLEPCPELVSALHSHLPDRSA